MSPVVLQGIEWYHAVNDAASLQAALDASYPLLTNVRTPTESSNRTVDVKQQPLCSSVQSLDLWTDASTVMLEVDIVGLVVSRDAAAVPYCGHDLHSLTSDPLSFDNFLATVHARLLALVVDGESTDDESIVQGTGSPNDGTTSERPLVPHQNLNTGLPCLGLKLDVKDADVVPAVTAAVDGFARSLCDSGAQIHRANITNNNITNNNTNNETPPPHVSTMSGGATARLCPLSAVWLNADILQGPFGGKPKFPEAASFLYLVGAGLLESSSHIGPAAAQGGYLRAEDVVDFGLSLGWTTGLPSAEEQQQHGGGHAATSSHGPTCYSWEDVCRPMLDLLTDTFCSANSSSVCGSTSTESPQNNETEHHAIQIVTSRVTSVTFPVKLSLVQRDPSPLLRLVEETQRMLCGARTRVQQVSLTFWRGRDETIGESEIQWVKESCRSVPYTVDPR